MMQDDIQTANDGHYSRVSKMTLATFQASGWYTVDYSKAENIDWGW
jgi:hypothetical protein